MKLPNCFLVGAPRCGTTALATYLSSHPQVFFCQPKELFYWSDDCDALRREIGVTDLQQYLSLFAGKPQHRIIAEGSTTYLQSPGAIERILKFNPEARFLVMIRNPIDSVQSRHRQLLFCFDENVVDLREAWNLQAARRAGLNVPARSRTPQFLQYGEYARYSGPLSRFMQLVPEGQRRIIVFDDFASDPQQSHRDTLAFLDLPDDGRDAFPKIHDEMKYRFAGVHELLRFPPAAVAAPVKLLRRTLHRRLPGVMVAMRPFLREREERRTLPNDFRRVLCDYFRDDVRRISELLDRDLSHWTKA